MKTRYKVFAVMFFIIVLSVVGCTSTVSQTSPTPGRTPEVDVLPTATQPVEPTPTVEPAVAIVIEMVERVNAEDYAGAAELFADEAMVYLIGMPPTGMEIYRGKEQFRTFLEACCTGQNFVWEVTPGHVEDGTVFVEAKTWMDFTRELGVAPNSFHEVFVVRDGKITLYASTMTEDALAIFKPVLREVMPELFEVTLPENETPASEVTVTIADGTCAYDGPMTLQAGELTVNVAVQDQRAEKYAVSFFTLDADKDKIDLMASTNRSGPPSWSEMVFLKELAPNESQTYKGFYIEEGLLYMICWAGSPDIPVGNAGPFVVKP